MVTPEVVVALLAAASSVLELFSSTNPANWFQQRMTVSLSFFSLPLSPSPASICTLISPLLWFCPLCCIMHLNVGSCSLPPYWTHLICVFPSSPLLLLLHHPIFCCIWTFWFLLACARPLPIASLSGL